MFQPRRSQPTSARLILALAFAGIAILHNSGLVHAQRDAKAVSALDLVPADGFAFVHFRLAQMRKNAWAGLLPKEALGVLSESPLPFAKAEVSELIFVVMSPRDFGFGGARHKMEKKAVGEIPAAKQDAPKESKKGEDPCGPKEKEGAHDEGPESSEPLFIFQTVRKINPETDNLTLVKKNGPLGGAIYRPALFGGVLLLPDGKTGVFSFNEKTLLRIGKGKGELTKVALALGEKEYAVGFGLAVSDGHRAQWKEDLADPFMFGPERFLVRLMLPFTEVRSGYATLSLGKHVTVQADGTFTSPAAAGKAKLALEDTLVLLRVMGLAGLEEELHFMRRRSFSDEKELEIAQLEALLEAGEQALRQAKVTAKENEVVAEATMPLGVDQAQAKAKAIVKDRADDPSVKSVRLRAANTDNLKQIALAMHGFHDSYKSLPPQAICDKNTGKPLLSWRVAILPFVEQNELYRQFKLDEPWDSKHNIQLLNQIPPVYAPIGFKTEKKGHTLYQVFTGKGAFFESRLNPKSPFGAMGLKIFDAHDGTANTLMIVEGGNSVPWTKPEDIPFSGLEKAPVPPLGGMSKEGFLAAFGDGSVIFIRLPLDPTTYYRLVHRADGNTIPDLRR